MTVTEKHAEWISLVEVSGPFLAVSVLEDAFPQGLDKVDTPARQRIRSAYDEWRDAVDESDPQLDALHREWVRLVIEGLLEYDASVLKSGTGLPDGLRHHDAQADTTFRPDFAVMAGDKPKLLISVTPPNTDLDNPLSGDAWLASSAERMVALCRTCKIPVGLVTNGDRWMVVSAPAEGGSSRASWYARLWFQEPVTLQAFCSLLGVRRCFGEEAQTLDALLTKSLEYQNDVTVTLGEQVRRAVEVLVQALDRADQDRNRTLLKDVTPAQLFEAGLTVMMRLVFLLCAEERRLLLLGEPIYDQNYAITTLRSQLVAQASHGLEILERRQDAWSRLLATFRGVYGGISHETLRLPPLGGSLFDPDRFPFLEGRAPGTSWRDTPAVPLPIDNRTVLLLLSALQILEHRSGAQLLSYESLDVEQIGHVYEGLLERTVKRVPEVTVGLVASSAIRKKTGHPEIYLSELESAARAGQEKLAEYLIEQTGRSVTALRKDITNPLPQREAQRLLLACGNDLSIANRIRPFGLLLRTDSWGDPLVYRENAFIVTHGTGRRETGSHYTPKSLTEPIVQHTLEPLVYIGPAKGVPRAEWKLRSPAEILAMKVCDMAMGSGAFLVQVCRWLADRLVEAWDMMERLGKVVSFGGEVLDNAGDAEILPRDQAERILIARRLVADRCLYGVDINPMAVEMAKLSLWLITLQRDRPFTFLDHALKCGDSLLGVSSVQQIENFSLRPGERQVTFATANLFRYVDEASAKRRALEDLPSNDHIQIKTKNRLHAEAEAATAKVKALADCLIAFELRSLDGDVYEEQRTEEAEKVQLLMKRDGDDSLKSQTLAPPKRSEGGPTTNQLSAHAAEQLQGRRPFHWPVEFPEVFARGGFDSFVGNPPFLWGMRISTTLGDEYFRFLQFFAGGRLGAVDLCAHFLRRSASLVGQRSLVGLILVDTIAQGDTREIGLAVIEKQGFQIIRAVASQEWPGTAGVKIALVNLFNGEWNGVRVLDGGDVQSISTRLLPESEERPPCGLMANHGRALTGQYLLGQGFVLSPSEAEELISSEPAAKEIIFDYVRGEDINQNPTQSTEEKVINFGTRSLTDCGACFPVALERIRRLVKPERDDQKDKVLREKWWLYARIRPELIGRIANRKRVLVQPFTTKFLTFSFVSAKLVFAHPLVVIDADTSDVFACLQSSLHDAWVRKYGSKMGDRIRYTTSDCFDNFPFPQNTTTLSEVGEAYIAHKAILLASLGVGLTTIYNRFHDRGEQSVDIARLRALHVEMDQAVAAAYGWSDLDLGHGFHATKQGERYTLSEPARRTVLDRLLALNHQRYEEELKAGLHDKKKAGTKRKTPNRKPTEEQGELPI
jgi:hypothetical protein